MHFLCHENALRALLCTQTMSSEYFTPFYYFVFFYFAEIVVEENKAFIKETH